MRKITRADVIAMACFRLAQLRSEDALNVTKEKQSFEAIFGQRRHTASRVNNNPFINKNKTNPFGGRRSF